ncbi:hypothetical protein Gpo141_00010597 [Globisporangium polare]
MQSASHLQFQRTTAFMPPSSTAAIAPTPSPDVLTPVDCTATLLSDASPQSTSSDSDSEDSDTVDLHALSAPVPFNLHGRFRSESGASSGSFGSATLNRIEFLEVAKKVKRDGVSYYVIDVYLHRSEHQRRSSESAYTPTAAARISGSDLIDFMLNEREPDYQIEHRFADFRELKNSLQVVAEQHAPECVHCQTLSAYLMHADNQSWTVKRLLKSTSSRQELLSKFVNGVLSLTSESEANNRLCLANDQVMEMVEAFLKRHYEVSLGII